MDTLPPQPGLEPLPPAPGEVVSSDVLTRRRKFSWKSFGGDGFLVSVAFHVLLVIAGLFYVVSRYTAPEKKSETEVFASGAGGGQNGDKAKSFEHRMQAKMRTPVKTPNRIVSKSPSASISLPSTPATATASFTSGLSAGGMSKGMGGGTGGGSGTGNGIGKGGGKNFVSLFGSLGRADRLVGSIYDFAQKRDGTPSTFADKANPSNNLPWMRPLVTAFIDGGWRLQGLDRYFKGPVELGVHQILIPVSPASAAPEAFEAKGKMQGSSWIAVYRGKVRAPETCELRFIGNADNFIAVRWDNKNILAYDCGKIPSPTKTTPGLRTPTASGKWIKVTKGEWYDVGLLIGDAGGLFSALLCYEKKDAEGKLILFRTEDIPFAEVLAKDHGDLPKDLDPQSPVWVCKAFSAAPVR